MRVIGITGPTGAGKTTISKIIENSYNAVIIDADSVVKKLNSNKNSEYYKKIVDLFGEDIVDADTKLKKEKIADIIYNNKVIREKLNQLTFKYVGEEINNRINFFKTKNYDYIVIDVPLLYEAKMENMCDFVIAVVAEDGKKISRICKRDNLPEEIAIKRLKMQNKNDYYVKKADFIIVNQNTFTELEKKLKEIMNKI